MKRYEGKRVEAIGGQQVWIVLESANRLTREKEPLPLRLDLYNHSPDGFQWGYCGSGPSQLALAILADCLGDGEALHHYQEFKQDVVSSWGDSWTITAENVEAWHRAAHADDVPDEAGIEAEVDAHNTEEEAQANEMVDSLERERDERDSEPWEETPPEV